VSALRKVVSGAHSGVDRAALDAALDLGLEAGGWVPKGRKADDGPLSPRYAVTETASRDHAQGAEWNVRDTDATLVLATGRLLGSSAEAAAAVAHKFEKPLLVVDLLQPRNLGSILFWLEYEKVSVLNVAGPRESEVPGIRAMAMEFLKGLLMAAKDTTRS
jgi:Circularly permutated YpsA SLOG family